MGRIERLIGAAASLVEFHLLRFWRSWVAALLVFALASAAWLILFSAPPGFVSGTIVTIERGTTAPEIARQLADAGIVRHAVLLREALRISGTGDRIPAGAYRFGEPLSLFAVALRLAEGRYGLPPFRVTFTEGMTVREMAERTSAAFPEITVAEFISAAQPYEGYLFPDTYTFTPADDSQTVVSALRANFVTKTKELEEQFVASSHSRADLITMASLIEREAHREDERRMISGILWNRIERGMPLQVDAVFGYIYGRTTYSPSFADLAVDSPYNTYKYRGLPPGPISNPGLSAIEAALNPTPTSALFYLTGRDGVTRYAATYEQHLANQRRYLP